MVISVKPEAPAKAKAAKTENAGTVDVVLVAHTRYHFKGTLFEKMNTYTVSAEMAKVLLADRTDDGRPTFIRKSDVKVKPIPEELKGPQTVDLSHDQRAIAGMSKDVARTAFNISSPDEDAHLEREIAARAEVESKTEATGPESEVEV